MTETAAPLECRDVGVYALVLSHHLLMLMVMISTLLILLSNV